MKIRGASGPTPPDNDIALGEVESKRSAPAEAATEARAVVTERSDPVREICADLSAGRLTPNQAVDRLIDLTVNAGSAGQLPEKVRATLRANLEELLRQDPFLLGKARRLGLTDLGKDE